jgi:hypothetical protein
MVKEIGIITEVKGIKVKCKLFDLLPPFLIYKGEIIQGPRINTLVKTKVGIDTIICQVNGELSSETDGIIRDHYLDLDVKGYIEEGKFIQGLRLLPIVAATVELLDDCDFKIIYQIEDKTAIMLGNDIFDTDKKIGANVNYLMPSHIGVFGNTGSGKSNTLAKMISEYSNKFLLNNKNQNLKLIIFDLNNEYGKDSIVSIDDKKIYTLKTRTDLGDRIPFDFSKLTEDDFIVILNASEKVQTPVVKNAFKNAYSSPKTGGFYKNYIKSALINARRAMFFSLRNQLRDYITNLDNFHFHSGKDFMKFYYEDESGRYYDNQRRFYDEMELIQVNIPSDKLDRFLFELCFAIALENENGTNIDFIIGLLSRASKIFNDMKKVFDFSKSKKNDFYGGKEIVVIQLANVNSDMRELVPSLLASVIFNDAIDSKGDGEPKSIVSIVIDEAHNLLYEEKNNVFHDNTLNVFEKVIKEGRKFGVFVYLASQRPSDISTTILSQLHNYFIHKLVNPSDLYAIQKTVAFLDVKALDFLTVLSPGECIVSGIAFQMPRFLYVQQLEKRMRPNSENVVLVGEYGITNSINREEALKIWEQVYGKKEMAEDCFGTKIIKEDYEDYDRVRKADDGNEYTYAWTVVFKKPSIYGGKQINFNLQIVHLNYKNIMRDNIKFEINGKKYMVKNDKKGYPRIIDILTNTAIDVLVE